MKLNSNTEEELAKSSAEIERGMKSKKLNLIFKHQVILTVIQYVVTIIILFIGICFYFFLNTSNFKIGSITLNDITLQNIDINIGTILILISLYMFTKITLDLNIKIYKGEE